MKSLFFTKNIPFEIEKIRRSSRECPSPPQPKPPPLPIFMLPLRQNPAYVTMYAVVRIRLIYFSVTKYPSNPGCPINVQFCYSAGDF